MVEIATSILNIKKEEAIKTLYNLEAAKTDYFHIDVMDGKFVQNNTNELMLTYCEYLNSITNLPLDVHLMVEDVKSFIDSYLVFEPNRITIHWEAVKDKKEVLKWLGYIKENNCRAGLSIKPNTQLEEIYEILPFVHQVLIMTVEPGKGGQALIPEMIEKIKKLKQYLEENKLEVDIEVDGGINLDNVEEVKKAGVNIIVAGTSIIEADDPKQVIQKMKQI